MEILANFKNDVDALGFMCYFSQDNLYLMGGKRLNLCTSEEIVVLLRKNKFQVLGANLVMEQLSKGQICIKGKIQSINIL